MNLKKKYKVNSTLQTFKILSSVFLMYTTVPLKLLPSIMALQNCQFHAFEKLFSLYTAQYVPRLVNGNSQHRFIKDKPSLNNLHTFSHNMAGFGDEGRAVENSAKPSVLPPTVFSVGICCVLISFLIQQNIHSLSFQTAPN